MNVSTRLKHLFLGAGLALTVAGMAVGAVGAQQPDGNTIVTPGQTSIVTDKDSYVVGEPITITYTLPGPGRIRITDHQAGKVSTLRAGYSAQAQGRIGGTVTPPVGKECLKLEYRNSRNQSGVAETCFEVTNKADPGQQMVVPGLYTLQHRRASLMLESNVAKKVYVVPAADGDFQRWVLETAPDGYVFLRNLATGYYLDSNPMSQVYTHEKNLGIFQQWKVGPGREGSLVLLHRATGLRLTADDMQGVRTDGEPPSVLDGYEWTLTAVQP